MKTALIPTGGIVFPMGTVDDRMGAINTRFALAETEVTNDLAVKILQWAYDNGKLNDTATAHNSVNSTTVRYGRQVLVALNNSDCRISFSGGRFFVDYGYENHPLVWVSWYGAVILCNWLTEMEDGSTDNVVYSGIPADGRFWQDDDTVEDRTQTGYRLPTTVEWEYAARYLGRKKPMKGPLSGEYIFETTRYNGPATLTSGYYWTPGDYASGATADCGNASACAKVAVYYENSSGNYPHEASAVAGKKANNLGIYDMSGNVWEWCQTDNGFLRLVRGVGWSSDPEYLHVGFVDDYAPVYFYNNLGFRLCKTLD